MPLPSPNRATCPTHLILLDFITRTIVGEEYRSWSSSLWNFLQLVSKFHSNFSKCNQSPLQIHVHLDSKLKPIRISICCRKTLKNWDILKLKDFWNMMLLCFVCSFQLSEVALLFRVKQFKVTLCHISEDLNLQQHHVRASNLALCLRGFCTLSKT
jgi:hypothetical protein